MYIEKEEFGKALKGALLTEAEHPRLTEDGEIVIEYGLEKVLNHPELSTDQQIVAILEYVPEQLKAEHGDRLIAAVDYYFSSLIFSDEEMGIASAVS